MKRKFSHRNFVKETPEKIATCKKIKKECTG
jgi:hypothetical protein